MTDSSSRIRWALLLASILGAAGCGGPAPPAGESPAVPASGPAVKADASREKLSPITAEKDPGAWGHLERKRGDALFQQARGRSAAAAALRLAEAVEAYRAALAAFAAAQEDLSWAQTQDSLAAALHNQAQLSGDSVAVARLRGEEVAAYRAELAVYERQGMGAERAATQKILGWRLYEWSLEAGAEESGRLLEQAAAAYRDALEILQPGEENQRDYWANGQTELAMVLETQAGRTHGAAAARLLSEAVAGFQLALGVYSREHLPYGWARTKGGLSLALRRQAGAASGAAAARLFAEAEAALKETEEVYTRKDLPNNWAISRNNLADLLTWQYRHGQGEEAERRMREAVAAGRQALEVWGPDSYPQEWPNGQATLGAALLVLGRLQSGTEREQTLGEAEKVLRGVLEVHTREAKPQDWAMAQNDLGEVLLAQGKPEAALQAFTAALEVRQRQYLPGPWIQSRRNQGKALEALGRQKEAAAARAEILAVAPEEKEKRAREAALRPNPR